MKIETTQKFFNYWKTLTGKHFVYRDLDSKNEVETIDILHNAFFKYIPKEAAVQALRKAISADEGYGVAINDIIKRCKNYLPAIEEEKDIAAEQAELLFSDYCRTHSKDNLTDTTLEVVDVMGGFGRLSKIKVGYETEQYKKKFQQMYKHYDIKSNQKKLKGTQLFLK